MQKIFKVGRRRHAARRPAAGGQVGPGVSIVADRLHAVSHSPLDELLDSLGASAAGLGAEEAQARLREHGPNEIAQDRAPAWFVQLLHAFWNPFILVLAALAIVSLATGDLEAVLIIAVMVLVSVLIRFWQEYRSGKAAEELRRLVRTTATVLRPEVSPTGGAAGAVPGQQHGVECPLADLVPGDIVHLSAGDMVPADVRLMSAKDLFLGESALTGESLPVEKFEHAATAIAPAGPLDLANICFMGTNVVSGTATAVVVATGAQTYFGATARGVLGARTLTSFDRGVNSVSWLLIRFMLVMVPLVLLLNGFTKGDWTQAFLFAISVAVGLTPEMLPMIVTANLARGAVRMAKRKTVVKRLNAIQNLGAMDVLCTDKTGTLTRDRIILERHLNVVGEEDDAVLSLAFLNSHYQTGLKNLLDVAVLEHGELRGLLNVERDYAKVDEIPFDFVRRRMSVVVEEGGRRHRLICKGAVEEILRVCTRVQDEGRVLPLGEMQRQTALAMSHELNEDGLRVVAVAYRDFAPQDRPYTLADEAELVLAGFIGFLDPPKESTRPALEALLEHGVTVKILTGDNEVITRKVCREVGLEAGRIVLGREVEPLSAEELAELAERTTVFARLTPDQKRRVVEALRSRGHTVGFLGDGINDAGALRAADVGISVDGAVDIARESADIILLEKSLMVLEEGVIEGRKTFGNIIKYIKMTASSNFGNVLSVLGASALLPFLPMLPLQLLIQNLLYDLSQLSIPWDEMDEEYLKVPRRWDASDIGRFMLYVGPTSSIFDYATFAVLWFGFGASTLATQGFFHSGWFIEGLISQTLVVHMIRTAKIPFLQSWAAPAVIALTGAIIALGVAIPFTSFGAHIGLQPLPGRYFPWLVAILIGYCLLVQIVKVWYIRRFARWL